MSKRLLVIPILAIMFIGGCSNVDKSKYMRMEEAKKQIEYTMDMDKYSNAILYLMDRETTKSYSTDNISSDILDIIDDTLLNDNGAIDDTSEYDMYSEESGKNPYTNIELFGKDGEYPIYGEMYTIYRYGTLEEAKEAIEVFNAAPMNKIVSYSANTDTIIARLSNKYTGGYTVRFKLVDGVITEYKLF